MSYIVRIEEYLRGYQTTLCVLLNLWCVCVCVCVCVRVCMCVCDLNYVFEYLQPFEDRKKWFYENLYSGNPPSNQLILTSNDSEIIVDRGIYLK